jgi:hypothetical protein
MSSEDYKTYEERVNREAEENPEEDEDTNYEEYEQIDDGDGAGFSLDDLPSDDEVLKLTEYDGNLSTNTGVSIVAEYRDINIEQVDKKHEIQAKNFVTRITKFVLDFNDIELSEAHKSYVKDVAKLELANLVDMMGLVSVPPNLRISFVNVPSGPVNTVVVFQQGDTAGLAAIFGSINRKQERLGNYSLRTCQDAIAGGPIGVINIRAFSLADQVGIAGISPNFTTEETSTTEYDNVFSTNGFWTVQAKNIQGELTKENYLNLANVGAANVSTFIVSGLPINYQPLTSQYSKSLKNMSLQVDDYAGLDMNMLLSDTFVDVYIFNNVFDPSTVSTNRYYGSLFNQDGSINYENLPALALIPEAGFNRVVSGSLIPNLVSETGADISIDTVLNNSYPQTGVIGDINDNLLEEDLTEPAVLNLTGTDYYNPDGTLNTPVGGSPHVLSHRFAAIGEVSETDLDTVHDSDVANMNAQLLYAITGAIFPQGEDNGNKVLSVYEQGTRIGDEIVFTDSVTTDTKTVEVVGIEILSQNNPTAVDQLVALAKSVLSIPAPTDTISVVLNWTAVTHATAYSVYRKKSTDSAWTLMQALGNVLTLTDTTVQPSLTYQYYVLAIGAGYVSSISAGRQITTIAVNGDYTTIGASTATANGVVPADLPTTSGGVKTYSVALLTLSGNVTASGYTRKKSFKGIAGIGCVPTALAAYVPRAAQFTDGTAATQSSILDVIVSPSIVKGLASFAPARYLVDGFKSFVEAGYKRQFGALALALDKKNTFVRNIINEPFIRDLTLSTNPLFKQAPGMPFDPTYLPLGGNPDYSTVLLTKFVPGSEMSFFFGSGQTDVKGNVYPVAGAVSNAFLAKQFAYDVVANATGYLTGVSGLEDSPNGSDDRLPFEQFLWNPIITQKGSFTIYGNFTGQKENTSLQTIHNSELLAFIKGQLLAMSVDDPFKKGVYNEYLATQTEVNTFFQNLALAGAILPNPVVICDATNNTQDISKAKIKLIHVEYTGVDCLDKVVFDLNLN